MGQLALSTSSFIHTNIQCIRIYPAPYIGPMKSRNSAYSLLGVAFVLFALISLVNHYNFRTYALDLGLYTNALRYYRIGQMPNCLLFTESADWLLSDHFDLYLPFFSPLSFILGNTTLLWVQIAAVLWGAWGVFRYFEDKQPELAFWAMFWFLSFYGIYSAISFDYHSNVVAAMCVPWIWKYAFDKKPLPALLCILFFLAGKENMSLWGLFLGLTLTISQYKNTTARALGLVFSFLSLLWFWGVISHIMPSLSSSGTYNLFHYGIIGNSPKEALLYVVTHPIETIRLLFVNHRELPEADYLKLELHVFLLVSGLWLLFKKPIYLFALIPIFGQKLFHHNYGTWGISGQYSIEFAPIMAIGIFEALAGIQAAKWRKIMLYTSVIGSLMATRQLMIGTHAWVSTHRIRFYEKAHYVQKFDKQPLFSGLKKIPHHVPVSVQSPILPHLATQNELFQFPIMHHAQYVVLSPVLETYPLDQSAMEAQIEAFKADENWEIFDQSEVHIIFKKR